MKRIVLLGVCAILGLNGGAAFAFDSVEAAYFAVDRAGEGLKAQAEDALRGASFEDGEADLATTLAAFSRIAADARDTMDALEGPHDLRCIFNGMSDDALRRAEQLAEAADAAARQAVLEDIAFLGEDAVLVTPEVEADNDIMAGLPPMECGASLEHVDASSLQDLLAQN